MSIADIHKTYSVKYRQLMTDMVKEINEALAYEHVGKIAINPSVDAEAHRDKSTSENIDQILLVDASLGLTVYYRG